MNLYIPVETVARELDGKLLLALHASARGFTVILGNRSLLSNAIHRFEPGIFLTHNFTWKRRRILRILRQLGHRIVGLDEEGLVWPDEHLYCHRRVDPKAVSCLDVIFAWGKIHAAAMARPVEEQGTKIVLAGNPRADVLRADLREIYRPRVEELHSKFGNFILINSNFGVLNVASSAGREGGEKTDEELCALAQRLRFPVDILKFRYSVFREFIDLLPHLSQHFSDRQIIIRPHPSENPIIWQQASKGLDNIQVHYDDELIPWLMAADAVIHNGCTTSIERAALSRPAIMYRPVFGGDLENQQPLSVSVVVNDKKALFDAIANPPSSNPMIEAALVKLISSLKGPSSAERIVETISALPQPVPSGSISSLIGKARSVWRAGERSVRGLSKSSLANPDYVSKKFPPMSADEISTRMQQIAQHLKMVPPQVSELSDRIFLIKNSKSDPGQI